jgi:hypothetical protein
MNDVTVLQLCCFTNLWDYRFKVDSWDLRLKKNIFDVPWSLPSQYDIVCASPPCDQFTKANSHSWEIYPDRFIQIALRSFELCKLTGRFWFLENPPGRIEHFIPALTQFRSLTWRSPTSNKEYVIYSNFLLVQMSSIRYRRSPVKKFDNMSKRQRESWDPSLISDVIHSIYPDYE